VAPIRAFCGLIGGSSTGRARLADVGSLAELLFVDPLLMVALVDRGI
jgi:hypothetical protein